MTVRQTSAFRRAHWQPATGLQLTRTLLRITAFAFGLGVTLPTLAQTINGSSIDVTGQSTLQGDVVMGPGTPGLMYVVMAPRPTVIMTTPAP